MKAGSFPVNCGKRGVRFATYRPFFRTITSEKITDMTQSRAGCFPQCDREGEVCNNGIVREEAHLDNMTLLLIRHDDDKLNQSHATELIRRYGTFKNINYGWAMGKNFITSKIYTTGEILTTSKRKGKITHVVEDY